MQLEKQQLSEILEDDGETECDGGAGIGGKGLTQMAQGNTVDSGHGAANILVTSYSSNAYPEPQLKGMGCGLEQATNRVEESSPFENAPARIEDQHHELSVSQI